MNAEDIDGIENPMRKKKENVKFCLRKITCGQSEFYPHWNESVKVVYCFHKKILFMKNLG